MPTSNAAGTPGSSRTSEPRLRKRIDWEAVERDYRTGKFTLRELEAKHGASYSEISRKAKKQGWTKDLRDVIKAATDAAVLRDIATEAQRSATDVVLVAAEVNAQVLASHRKRLHGIQAAAEKAKEQVLKLLEGATDYKEVVALSSAIEGLSRLTKTVIDKEREAHNIQAGDAGDESQRKSLSIEFVDAEPPADG